MGIISKIIMYVFGTIGLLLSVCLVSIYILLHNKMIDERAFVEYIQKHTKINFSVVCKQCESKNKDTMDAVQKPYNVWLIENLDSEQAARSLLSLNTDEIVKYLITMEKEKSLKVLEGIYATLDEQGDFGKKRKQEIDKKMLGGIK